MGIFKTKNEENLYDLSQDIRNWKRDWDNYKEYREKKPHIKGEVVLQQPLSNDDFIKEVLSKKYRVSKN